VPVAFRTIPLAPPVWLMLSKVTPPPAKVVPPLALNATAPAPPAVTVIVLPEPLSAIVIVPALLATMPEPL